MNVPASSPFRGSTAIDAVVARMRPLADWLSAFRPECKVITVPSRDLDVLRRYPQAADALHQIVTSNGVTYWRGFELRGDQQAARSANVRKQITPR